MSKSIDFIEKKFDSKIKRKWWCTAPLEFLFIELYIKKKYNKLLHYIPYTSINIIQTERKSNVSSNEFNIINYELSKKYNIKKDKKEFEKYYNSFRNTSKRFTFFQVTQTWIESNDETYNHALFFLYDKLLNQVELFDSQEQDYYYFRNFFNKFFKKIYGNKIKIIYPDFIFFFQDLENIKCKNKKYFSESDGFCSAWSLWYLEIRLKNENLSRQQINDKIYEIFIKDKNDRICKLIRGYSQFINKITDDFNLIRENNKIKIIIKNKKTTNKYIIPKTLISLLGISGAILFIMKKLNLFK